MAYNEDMGRLSLQEMINPYRIIAECGTGELLSILSDENMGSVLL